MQRIDIREGKRTTGMFLAWDIAVPAAIGSIPVLGLMAIKPPPYPVWDSTGYVLLLVMIMTGLTAGLLGLRRGSVFIAVGVSFWLAQSFAGWYGTCVDITSATSCGPGAGADGLFFAAIVSLVLGVGPLAAMYCISSLVLRPDPRATKA